MQKFYNKYYKMLHEILCVMAGSAIAIIVYFLVKASKEAYENKKVCVFDIDNTLTAAPDKTSNTLQSHSGYPASNFAAQATKISKRKRCIAKVFVLNKRNNMLLFSQYQNAQRIIIS